MPRVGPRGGISFGSAQGVAFIHVYTLPCLHIKEKFATCKQGCSYHTDAQYIFLYILSIFVYLYCLFILSIYTVYFSYTVYTVYLYCLFILSILSIYTVFLSIYTVYLYCLAGCSKTHCPWWHMRMPFVDCLIPCLSFCPCPCWSAGLCAATTVSICCVQYCALYGSCCCVPSVLCYQGCMLLLVGNLYGGPSCIDWGSWQYCLFILCWVVLTHLFQSLIVTCQS
jgi:hypothetical protein